MKKWKILSSEDVSLDKWMPIIKDSVQITNGKIGDYFTNPYGNVAMVLPVLKNGDIVFVKQYKHGIREIMIELPAGFQQKNATVKKSALAELEEETGIKTTLDNLKLLGKSSAMPSKSNLTIYCYLATNLEFNSQQNLDETEDIEILTIKPSNVIKMINDGEIWASDTVTNLLKFLYLNNA